MAPATRRHPGGRDEKTGANSKPHCPLRFHAERSLRIVRAATDYDQSLPGGSFVMKNDRRGGSRRLEERKLVAIGQMSWVEGHMQNHW